MPLRNYVSARLLLPLLAACPAALADHVDTFNPLPTDFATAKAFQYGQMGMRSCAAVLCPTGSTMHPASSLPVALPGSMAELDHAAALAYGWAPVSALHGSDLDLYLTPACHARPAACRAMRPLVTAVVPVPEPGAWSMLAGGLVLLLWRARQRTVWIVTPEQAGQRSISTCMMPSSS
jgi:hypothetical protein